MAIITIPDDYLTIQEGLNNAVSGDTVYVKNGTYNEVVSMATNNIILEA
ncbi:MAG: plasmid stabilization protein, partial [Candidatus Asgardarchaeum californiense]